ncbi:MAG: class I SAM-dependent methyltransferase [Chloroflexi bacterium]|nr:class I SAM-dependent methyltransferase [Chloroflexota bacterium]
MERKFDAEAAQRLLSPERVESLDIHHLLALLPLRPYHTVADVGCGPGYFTVPLAKFLRQGKVFAVDVQEEMLLMCRQQVERARLSNVEVVRTEDASLPLAEASLDGAFLAFVLHEVQDRKAFMQAVAVTLKPGGWCAVVEWQPGPGELEGGPPPERRLGRQQVETLAKTVGMRLKEWRELNAAHYLALLTK